MKLLAFIVLELALAARIFRAGSSGGNRRDQEILQRHAAEVRGGERHVDDRENSGANKAGTAHFQVEFQKGQTKVGPLDGS